MKVNGDRNECRQDIQARLKKKIEGQVRGISRMVDEERDCKDIMVQLTAVKPISQVGTGPHQLSANCLGEDLVKDQSVQENLDKFSDLLGNGPKHRPGPGNRDQRPVTRVRGVQLCWHTCRVLTELHL